MNQNHIQLEYSRCPLDCPANDEFILKGYDRLHGLPGEFQVVRCLGCGLMRTNPRPTLEAIGFYYPEDYGPFRGTRVNLSTSDKTLPRWKQIVRKLFRFNTRPLPNMKVGRLLEIGCASGAFIYKMASLGWDVEGIELSAGAANAAHALGLNVHIGSAETFSRPARSYDLIVGWMVLEHLHDPVGVLKKLASWADAGSWLVLSMPNANSLEFRLFKEKWYALHLPNHLYHYTPQTIRMVLERAGWRIERLFHQRVLYNFIASLGYQFEDSRLLSPLAKPFISFPENSGYWNYVLYPAAYLLSTVGQTGRMTLWARKADD